MKPENGPNSDSGWVLRPWQSRAQERCADSIFDCLEYRIEPDQMFLKFFHFGFAQLQSRELRLSLTEHLQLEPEAREVHFSPDSDHIAGHSQGGKAFGAPAALCRVA
jgi:hypothetical protein